MNIIGLDGLVFGVDDVNACNIYLQHMGLRVIEQSASLGIFEALDGTSVTIRSRDDAALPEPLPTGSMLRETIYGVDNTATLDSIAAELRRDRAVIKHDDGSIGFYDDDGFALRCKVSARQPLCIPASVAINVPGTSAGRAMNAIGNDAADDLTPRTLSHVVYFVPDFAVSEAFYTKRLGFRCTDRFTNAGPFLRGAGMDDHHSLFLIQTPPHMKGIEHFAFHMAGPSAVLAAGTKMVNAGFQSFWGPGRHLFGSNWFWYFNCPMGCHAEFDADMDRHDDSWVAREAPMSPDASQSYLFAYREKWAPGGPPPNRPADH